jgi:hypothetical protein
MNHYYSKMNCIFFIIRTYIYQKILETLCNLQINLNTNIKYYFITMISNNNTITTLVSLELLSVVVLLL